MYMNIFSYPSGTTRVRVQQPPSPAAPAEPAPGSSCVSASPESTSGTCCSAWRTRGGRAARSCSTKASSNSGGGVETTTTTSGSDSPPASSSSRTWRLAAGEESRLDHQVRAATERCGELGFLKPRPLEAHQCSAFHSVCEMEQFTQEEIKPASGLWTQPPCLRRIALLIRPPQMKTNKLQYHTFPQLVDWQNF